MVRLRVAFIASVPLVASAGYTSEANKKFTPACVDDNKITDANSDECADGPAGEAQCDAVLTCNSFIRNDDNGLCYRFNTPAADLAGCTEASPVSTGKHTPVFNCPTTHWPLRK